MSPLTRSEAEDVLRYWLASLRLEEALDVRPLARKPTQASARPRLDLPTPGQDYFKLPLDGAFAALCSRAEPHASVPTGSTALRRRFDGELAGFFETWLHAQYRRGEEESELSHLVCFPVIHLPRGELAGLLRCSVRLRFGLDDGRTFRVPSRADRQRGLYPDAPNEVRVATLPRAQGAWPFFVDTRLLRHTLGVSSERIDALFEALRAEESVSELTMIAQVAGALEAEAGDSPALSQEQPATVGREAACMEDWLARLHRAMCALLERSKTRAQAYPVAIVLDGTQARTTWHLQRELSALLEGASDSAGGWQLGSALGAYLTGRPQAAREGVQRALFYGPPLSESQRDAADHFWGSTLSAVQGPPGTGKTRLILHLCAEFLVERVARFVAGGAMDDSLFVVASSNNRAVDNVVEPLSAVAPRSGTHESPAEGLPLALRAGSRQLCEQLLTLQLRSALAWLKRAESTPAAARNEELGRKKQAFQETLTALERLLGPRRLALKQREERSRVEARLAELDAMSAATGEARSAAARPAERVDVERAQALLATLSPLEKRLLSLSRLCEAQPGLAEVNAVARHFGRTAARELPPFEHALAAAGLTLELPLPPLVVPMDRARLMESWEEATELCLHRLGELREGLEAAVARRAQEAERSALRAELAQLGALADHLPSAEHDDALSLRLFEQAVAVRDAWAKLHAGELCQALELSLQALEQERSLRPLFRNEPRAASWLCRLFGVWGSTLLSLGNCIPPEPGSIARLVIDEAGQCHPAHAVSALMRCEAALVIGDVHQLTPVIALGPDEEARLFRSCGLRTSPERLSPYRVHADTQVSVQSLADRAVLRRLALVDHYRCQPEIIALSDALCGYGLTVHTARRHRGEIAAFLRHPLNLVDVRGEQERLAGSLYNEAELERTLAMADALLDGGLLPQELAVITPYRGQLELLRRGFAERGVPLEYSPELTELEGPRRDARAGVALGTVHRFQGGERSVVLFTTVITRTGSLPFLNERPNLLNVALSRAQHHFVCLGHRTVLAQGARTRLLTSAAHPLIVA